MTGRGRNAVDNERRGPIVDLHMLLLHWVGEHSRDGVRPEHAARELGIDVDVAMRLFRDLERAGFIRADPN